MKRRALFGLTLGVLVALAVGVGTALSQGSSPAKPATAAGAPLAPGLARATFAGGCFWCVESDFDKVPGVVSTTSGYIGGHVANPSYELVSAKLTGHAEAVEIVFDTTKVSYAQLLEKFWRSIDPTTKDRQFCDSGSPYRSAIFTHGPEQAEQAHASKAALDKNKPFSAPIVTQIHPATAFYPAEEYHQDYHLKNPVRYKLYRNGCGRDARLAELWGAAK
jgi:peptide-methionine (S)-S-oxide reductase